MIFTESTIKISNNVSKMDSTIVLYRGDKNVEIRFTILQSPFKYSNTVATNVIESTNASYGQLVIKTPNDKPPIFSEVSATKEGTVLFTITKEMIDEIEELGVYTFQIRLMDENKQSRVTIPPVENGIEIKEPIAIEDDNTTNVVGLAKANYAVATLSDVDTPSFDDNGQYIKTNWNDGDIITSASLNKIEDGIYTTNENVTATKKYVDDNAVILPLPIHTTLESTSVAMNIVNIMDLIPGVQYSTHNDPNETKKQGYRVVYICDDGNFKTICNMPLPNKVVHLLKVLHYTNYSILSVNNTVYKVDYSKHSIVDDVQITKTLLDYLPIINTIEFTPTTDYEPATKKYVDDNKIAYTVSSKVLTTVSASNIKLDNDITVNNVSINANRRYFIEFLGDKKLCSISVSEEIDNNSIMCSIGNYFIQAYNDSTNIVLSINKTNENDTTTTFTDLIIYEEEVKYLDSKYLEDNLVLQNSISLGRVGNIGAGSSAIGYNIEASGDTSHAEGYGTIASGTCSHAEGSNTTSSAEFSHAEGGGTTASGNYSHAEGSGTTASGLKSHAEGSNTKASGDTSHAEGYGTAASGYGSHAEGSTTTASGVSSHAEGDYTTASGASSHAEGYGTKASSQFQHVQGKYNIEDKDRKYAHIVGNGAGDAKRSNAHALDWKGNGWYAGKLSQEGTPTDDKDLATKKYVDDNILLEQLPILRIDETNKRIYVNCNNMGTYKKYFVPNKYANVYGFSFIYTNEDSSETEIALVGGAMTRDDFILCARNTDTLFILILGGTDKYTYTKSTKTLEKGLYGYLKIGNTQEYTPTNEYNPATKKYVDDNMKTAINGVKGDLGTEELTTTAKDLRGAVNELNTQYKDITNKDNIKWGAFDKGYITIVFDDFNDDLADVFTLFKSKNIPLSCAIPAIKIEQGKDTSVLHDVENNGGEILCHGYTSNPITSNSTIDFIKTEFEKSKFLLEKNGLRINGYVRAGGEGSIAFTDILDLFYKNYIYGFSWDEDKLLFSRESLVLTIDEFKRKVDNAVKNKQWVKFFAHGFHEVSSELLTQMLDYVNSSAIVPVTYSTMYSKFVIGNLNTERYMTKSDNISAFNYIKEIDDRTFYHEDVNLLKNSAWVNFTNDTKWVRDKTNYSKDIYWNVYDRGFYSAVRVNFSDKATVGSVKLYQDTGLSRATKGEILHAGLTVQQQTDNNSIILRIYKQLKTETELTLVAEKTYTGKLSDEYISVEWISEFSEDVTNYRYEIEIKHPDATSSNITYIYLPRLTFKKIDNRYKNITY